MGSSSSSSSSPSSLPISVKMSSWDDFRLSRRERRCRSEREERGVWLLRVREGAREEAVRDTRCADRVELDGLAEFVKRRWREVKEIRCGCGNRLLAVLNYDESAELICFQCEF